MGYALMTGKPQELYELIFDRLLLAASQSGYTGSGVTFMISDYEMAILRATGSRFLGGRPRGCYFHYGQVMYYEY